MYALMLLAALVFATADGNTRTVIWPRVGQLHSHRPLGSRGLTQLDSNEDATQHRSVRGASDCRVPAKVERERLDCTEYPGQVVCNQTCAFGHTLEEGIRREMRCSRGDGKWRPVAKFETCKPFVDCRLSLGPGAKIQCWENQMEKGPRCRVSCAAYEDRAAVAVQLHHCDIQGRWEPELPFCVRAGRGVKLVPPPKGPRVIADL